MMRENCRRCGKKLTESNSGSWGELCKSCMREKAQEEAQEQFKLEGEMSKQMQREER